MKIYGNILLNDKFFVGTIEVEDGKIISIVEKKEKYDFRGTVIPTFINMHTHIGDFFYSQEPEGDLEVVVGPGGLKHRILKDPKNVFLGMRKAMRMMQSCGISHFVDFREGGKEGVDLILKASEGFWIKPIVLGRGDLWDNADGVGISSISDVGYDTARYLSQKTHKSGKIFALHASENRREDIDKILSLKPNFVVHMLVARDDDLIKMKEKNIPLVITPRANAFWGKIPNIPKLKHLGLKISLGTDNGMISSPCMFREMEFSYRISRLQECKKTGTKITPEDVIKMATVIPREILGIHDNSLNEDANLIVFKKILTPYEIVTRTSSRDIRLILSPQKT